MTKKGNTWLEQYRRYKHFLEVGIWKTRLSDLPKWQRFGLKTLRVGIITMTEFKDDRVVEKASNLTYFSLLSIVPVIAMAFGISKGFGLEKFLEHELSRYFSGQEEVLNQVMEFAHRMIDSASGGIVAGIGLVILLYTVLRLLHHIETSFNHMWGNKRNRPIHRKLADYISIMILGIVLVLLSSSTNVFLIRELPKLAGNIGLDGEIKSGLLFLIRFIPYTFIWILLFLLYIIFPNTRVKVVPAVVAGIVAGTLYQLTQWGFINFQFAFARYNAIYGSLALLPLFLIYVQISWFIILFGMELCYAIQHVDSWEPEQEDLKISYGHRKKIMLLVMYRIIKSFKAGEPAVSVKQLSRMGSVPYRILHEICYECEKAGLVSRVEGEKGDDQFQPAFDIHQMDIQTVIQMYEKEGLQQYDNKKSKAFLALETALEEISQSIAKSKSNQLLMEL